MKFEIVILCRDRPETLFELLNCLALQTKKVDNIKISDNSLSSGVYEVVSQFLSIFKISYKLRSNIGFIDHFNINIEESSGEYICMLHDDDLLSEYFIDKISNYLEFYKNEDISAIAPNGILFNNKSFSAHGVFNVCKNERRIRNSFDLFRSYFWLGRTGINPFPSYVYKSEVLRKLKFNNECGKYSDVSFLAELVDIRPIIWVPDRLLYYRIHDSNDSGLVDANQLNLLEEYFRRKIKPSWFYYVAKYDFLNLKYPFIRKSILHELFKLMWRLMLPIRPAFYYYIYKKAMELYIVRVKYKPFHTTLAKYRRNI